MKFTKETLRRTLRTFLQAVAGFLATTGLSIFVTNDYNVSKNIIIGVIGSAVAAGMAAVMNLEENIDLEDNQKSESKGDFNVDNQ